jgi:predicted lipid-binding transport protein (Tim44 family)
MPPISSGPETSTSTAGIETSSTDAQRFLEDDNIALIGGIVGGVVALILIGGLVAFLVKRSRQRRANGEPNNDAVLQSVRVDAGAASHRSNYQSFSPQPKNAPPQNYDAWSTNDGNNYANPSPNHMVYEQGDVTEFR